MKHGFTLVEILIVIGVFAILMVAGTDFFLQVIVNSNQATIQNEVRQNVSQVLQQVTTSIRNAGCVSWTIGNDPTFDTQGHGPSGEVVLKTFSDNCSTLADQYRFSYARNGNDFTGTGNVYKTVGTGSELLVSPPGVAFIDCDRASQCGNTVCGNGIKILGTSGTSNAVTVSLTAQAQLSAVRADFCATFVGSDSATPRARL